MSIIVQAGHKTSKSKQLMEKLYERGLSRPNDSYTHKMTPEQVSENLYKVLVREDMSSANEKMADNVMIDFLLANLDSENWGWESDKNLASLEYWGQIEPDVRFILVFDHPKRLFDNIETEKLTTESINKIVDEWVSYHQGVLEILEADNSRSILVEGQSALQGIPNVNTQLVRIGSNIKLKSGWQTVNTQPIDLDIKKAQDSNFVSELIIDEILKNYPEAINIFNNLLSKADLKSSSPIYKTQRPKLVDLVESLGCLQSDTQSILDQYELKLNVLEQEKSDLVLLSDNLKVVSDEKIKDLKMKVASTEDSLKESQDKVVSIESRLQTAKNNIQSLEAELKKKTSINSQVNSSANIADIEKENELLIVQIHQLQEELERYYIENKKLKSSEVSKSEQTITDLEQQPNHYGAAERIKQDLPYRLGEKILKAKQPKHIVSLPFVLAKEYSDFQKNELSVEKLPPIELYKDAYEADKVKEHLSYKVGKVLVDSTKSPKKMVTLPKNLSKEVVGFYKNKKKT
jgi:hypothetical protein